MLEMTARLGQAQTLNNSAVWRSFIKSMKKTKRALHRKETRLLLHHQDPISSQVSLSPYSMGPNQW